MESIKKGSVPLCSTHHEEEARSILQYAPKDPWNLDLVNYGHQSQGHWVCSTADKIEML